MGKRLFERCMGRFFSAADTAAWAMTLLAAISIGNGGAAFLRT
eukprot:CAMPEP_0180044606 /NCGR_PEP_ID=MMETSP0984-20121128/36014_1 /TAXON_ID=483367 /ORGANISM="non described non described, Strain CCMP 2436" /LENGTH=42 /DNA_ID= /DNA_START= /DNA_END= /DNA_ORIENTATION=